MRRLAEVHRFWHRSMDNYGDPDEYLPDFNAAVQASRNATFALQKEKAKVPEFDAWYGPWQTSLAEDPIMGWMNAARVTLVHVGDLEARSVTRVRLIGDYFAAGVELVEELSELDAGDGSSGTRGQLERRATRSVGEIISDLRESDYPEQLLNEMTVSIERRWEEATLPGRELNAALGHAYAVVSNILRAAHERVDSHCEHTFGCSDSMPRADPGSAPRIARCMSTTRERRTIVLEATTGRPIDQGVYGTFAVLPFHGEDGAERYVQQLDLKRVEGDKRPVTVLDLLPRYVELAKAILRTGEEHGWFVLYFRGTTPIDRAFLEAIDAPQKRGLAQGVARRALELDATGVAEIGEAWVSPQSDDAKGFTRPADHPERREALVLAAETSSGLSRQAIVPFERPEGVGGPVIFGESDFVDGPVNNFLVPLRDAWALRRRQSPASPGASFRRPEAPST